MSEKITAMIEEIKGLTVLELSELVHALEEEFGVSAAAMAAPAAAAAPAAEEKTSFDVVLAGFDAASKIKVIKVVREITGQGLAEAKATVENAPSTLKEGLTKEDAEAMKKQIEDAGGKVETGGAFACAGAESCERDQGTGGGAAKPQQECFSYVSVNSAARRKRSSSSDQKLLTTR